MASQLSPMYSSSQTKFIDRAKAKEEEDADAKHLDFNKEVGPGEESEHDTFRLPTEEVTNLGSFRENETRTNCCFVMCPGA